MKEIIRPEIESETNDGIISLAPLWKRLIEQNPIKFYGMIRNFEEKLKHQFPDFIDYRAYHILNGTSAMPSFRLREDDFPGEFSVKDFLRKAQKELSEE